MKSLKQVGIDGFIWLQSRVLGDGFMFQDILKINLVNSNKRFNHSDESRGVGLIFEEKARHILLYAIRDGIQKCRDVHLR